MEAKCKVCQSETVSFANTILLGKYSVDYFQCSSCGFVQTEDPYWLKEAYSHVISGSDTGLVFRNYYCSQKASRIISNIFDNKSKFIDYGGGYGLFVRMMRDLGLNFYWDDKFCNNLFAQGFESDRDNYYELTTAFELFEHFVNPLEEIEKILQFSKNILFSTEILPTNSPKPGEWWYYVPHEGQHVSIYTLDSLSRIADKFHLNFYSSEPSKYGISLHLLTEKELAPSFFNELCHYEATANKKSSTSHQVTHLKIAFDISVLGMGYLDKKARTGVYRVTDYILKELINSSELTLYLCSSVANISSACQEYLKAEFKNIELPLFTISDLNLLNISLYHSPFHPIPLEVTNCHKIVTIYDLIPVKFPEFFGHREDLLIKGCLSSITGNDFINCISESTKKDLLSYDSSIYRDRVLVSHLAADENKFYSCQDRHLINDIHQKYNIPETPYLLSVCTLEPRKNLAHVIRCFLKLIQEKDISDLNLVLVGTQGWQYEEILTESDRDFNLRKRIIFTGFVPDEDLAPLYSDALAFLYLSIYEGFGLPPLEAMQCGTPVITSNTSSLPEVVGKAGIMLSPDDVDGLCNAIYDLYTKVDLQKLLSQKSLEQSEKFTWKKTFQQIIEIYKLAVAKEISVSTPQIIIDGVFFQLYQTGIARVWKSLLQEWANNKFSNHIIVLDRVGTSPKIEGISYYQIPAYDYNNTDADREMLQQVCDELEADLFISTYYTTPLETPSVFMGYDMIPEVLGADLNQPMWQEKRRAIEHASAYLTISENTAKDLVEIYSNIDPSTVTVAHCGVQSVFKQASTTNLAEFRYKYGISKPYFVISASGGYKNIELFLQAFDRLASKSGFDLIVTGGQILSQEDRQYTFGSNIHYLRFDDFELSLAYSGAIALVYPSKYEGFGLPIIEAMASGCPVITCPNASIPEVAGEAAIYVFDDDVDGMAEALCEVQKPQVRAALISAGLEQVKQFSWAKMGDIVKSVLIEQTLAHLQLSTDNLIIFPDWSQDEEALGEEIASVCYNLAQSSEFNKPTLLIDTTNVEDLESVNMLISGIAMNLMMGTDIDITEHLEIALTGNLAPIQWQALLPKLQGRIKLNLEDVRSIESSGANLISEIQLTESPALTLG